MFDGWDADIILPNEKIAIHWNGLWHYKKLRECHSLLQVQSRDRIKYSIIEKHGYTNYVIQDLGRFNRNFVQNKFDELCIFVKNRI